jgi:hypothetical protein
MQNKATGRRFFRGDGLAFVAIIGLPIGTIKLSHPVFAGYEGKFTVLPAAKCFKNP